MKRGPYDEATSLCAAACITSLNRPHRTAIPKSLLSCAKFLPRKDPKNTKAIVYVFAIFCVLLRQSSLAAASAALGSSKERTHSPAHPNFELFRAFGVFRVFGTFGVFDAFGANTPDAASATVDRMRQDRCNGRTKSGSEFRVPASGFRVVWWGEATDEPGLAKLKGYRSRECSPTGSTQFRVVLVERGYSAIETVSAGFHVCRQCPPSPANSRYGQQKEFGAIGGIRTIITNPEKVLLSCANSCQGSPSTQFWISLPADSVLTGCPVRVVSRVSSQTEPTL